MVDNETNRVLGKATGQVEALTHYIDRSVAKELVTLRRRVRKLERALRKAAGREKRLLRFKKWGIDGGLDKAKLILLEDGNVTEYELARWSLDMEIHTAHGKLARETTINARVGYDVPDDHAQCKCVVVENVNV